MEPRRRGHPRGRGVHAAAGEDRGAAPGLRRQGVRRARRGLQRDAAAEAADRGDPLRRAARDAGRDGAGDRRQRRATGSRTCWPSGRSPPSRCADADIAQLRAADGRSARPPAAAPLHRGRVPRRVHPPRRPHPPARAGPLRDHQRPGRSCATAAAVRSPPATSGSPSTPSTCSTPTGPRADLLAPGHPLHDAVADADDRAAASALDRGTVLVSPTVAGAAAARRRERGDRRRHRATVARASATPTSTATAPSRPPARRPYLDCVAAPPTDQVDRRARGCVARRRRGPGAELDHRPPAPRLPRRGQAPPRGRARSACASTSAAASTRRTSG